MNLSIRQKIVFAFTIPLLLMLFVATLLYVSTERQLETAKWVEHTHRVISQAQELLTLLVDMETGERGYLITGNKVFLEPFNNAGKVWINKLDNLKLLVSDNPTQVERLSKIEELQKQWLVKAVQLEISARSEVNNSDLNTMNTVIALIESQIGKKLLITFGK